MKKILVTGAGGFIGGHVVKELLNRGYLIRATDIKPFDEWYQCFEKVENLQLDMTIKENCYTAPENNKALCMLSVLVNTHMLMACKEFKIKRYFFSSSACAYNTELQKDPKIIGLKESDAYPAMPEDGYGWEKLFSERMCRHFFEDYGLDVKVARYHNIYGPYGTYDGGREKAPAALCRKVISAILNNKDKIDVWGDGNQTRSFLYIDDCVEATLKLFDSEHHGPINIGSEEQVSINEMIEKIEKISDKKVKKNYQLDKPRGVMGRNSDNTLIRSQLDWQPKFNLLQGLKKTYEWIFSEMKKKHNQ
jgi:nucleoside-diphosphate-sugar epimerase